MDIKELNKAIPDDLKIKIKNFLQKFDVAPIVTQVTPAAPVTTPANQFGEGLLEDGKTVIKYNTPTLSEGSIVTVVTPEGEMPAPEGTHKLQDGTEITVAIKDGASVVTAVKAVEPAPDYSQQAAQISGFKAQLETFAAEKETFANQIKEQKTLIENHAKEIEALKINVQEFVQLFVSVLEVPSGQPIEKPRNKFEQPKTPKKDKLLTFIPTK